MKVLLVSGGTGGHVFPALSAGYEFFQQNDCEIILLLDQRGRRFYDSRYSDMFRACYVLCDIQMRMHKFILLFLSMFVALKSLYVILRHRPNVVIGFGGICTIIPLVCCRILNSMRLCRIKIIAHEQNAVLGSANRFLRKHVDLLASHYPLAESDVYVRIPRRQDSFFSEKCCVVSDNALYQKNNHADAVTIVVLGGSQGADVFDDALPQALAMLSEDERKRLFIYQQTHHHKALGDVYNSLKVQHCLQDFFADAIDVMVASDIIICRAGASSLAEVMSLGKACIVVPYPHASDDHQERNAQFFAERDAVLYVSQTVAQYVELLSQHIRFFMDERNRESYAQQMRCALDDIDYVKFSDLCVS